jgi:hypothetical protein
MQEGIWINDLKITEDRALKRREKVAWYTYEVSIWALSVK